MKKYYNFINLYVTVIALVILFALLLPNARADIPPMPIGPHTQSITFRFIVTVPPHSIQTYYQLVPKELNNDMGQITVWTSVKHCFSVEKDITAKVRAHPRILNLDTMTGDNSQNQYYFVDKRDSWHSEDCSTKDVFETPIHIQHNLRVGNTITNFSDRPVFVKSIINLMAR